MVIHLSFVNKFTKNMIITEIDREKIIKMSRENNDINVFGSYNKIESSYICKILDFFKN